MKNKSEYDANRTGFTLAPMRNARRKKKQSNSLKFSTVLRCFVIAFLAIAFVEYIGGN